ncbi:MAG: hypothetical protein KGJ02_00075 [Verrucomicrobiota bacterium]|nr:hypothetical protein [Verrucomicrobiota bacterium]
MTKKLLLFQATLGFEILFCLFANKIEAVPVGNPASPAILQEGIFLSDAGWTQPRLGFLEDFTLNHPLAGDSLHAVSAEGFSAAGALIWSLFERLDLSLLLGSGNYYFQMVQGDEALTAQVNGGLIWYGEARLVLLEVEDTTFSAFGEAGGWNWMRGPFYIDSHPVANRAALKMRFWEVGVTLSQQVGLFSPYGGVVVMQSRWKMSETNTGIYYFHQKYPVGPLLGCTISKSSKILLNLEWRGWIENAFTLSGELRF